MPGTRRSRSPFGQVRKQRSGRYQARYRRDGGWVNAPTTFPTLTDARAWLATVQADMVRGTWTDPRSGRVLLRDYAERWLRERLDLRPSSREAYERCLTLHILPYMGGKELGKLTTPAVRTWYVALVERRSRNTAAKAYRVLAAIFNTAANDGLISASPCNIKGFGNFDTPEREPPEIDTVYRVIEVMAPRYKALMLAAMLTGLRLGELSALTRADLDLESATVRVDKQAQDLAGGRRHLGPPKSRPGTRTVTMPTVLVEALSEHLDAYVGPETDALVFVREDGRPLTRSSWANYLSRSCAAAGVEPFHFHDLRHRAGMLATEAGGSIKEVMGRLGHSGPGMALRYQHASDRRDLAIAAGIDAIVGHVPGGTPRNPPGRSAASGQPAQP